MTARTSRSSARALVALALGWAAALALAPATAAAQEQPASGRGDETVGLVLELDPQRGIDAARVREAVSRELGVPVTFDRNAPGGAVHVQQAGPRVDVWYEGPGGRREGRSFETPADPVQAERDIALLAVNVVQDQASAFVAPPPAPAGPTPAPAPPPPAAAATAAANPCAGLGPLLPIGVDFAPFVGMSSSPAWRLSPRVVSLGAIGTFSGPIAGAAASGALNIADGSLCGGAVAGVANVIAGPTRGVAVAGALNMAAGPVHGAQIGGVANVATGSLSGAQVAGIGNYAPAGSRGAQIAGAVNVTSGALAGGQVAGAVNVATETRGAQIAPINVTAGVVHGVQIGVVNVAETSDFSLGALNILYKGRLNLDLWALPEAGLLFAGLKNGGAHFHYIYGVGVRATDTHPVWLSLGLGSHSTPTGQLFVDVDALVHAELAFVSNNRNDLYQLRVVVGYRFLPELAAFAGPTFNVLNAWNNAPSGVAPSYRSHLGDTTYNRFDAWPGLALGLEGL